MGILFNKGKMNFYMNLSLIALLYGLYLSFVGNTSFGKAHLTREFFESNAAFLLRRIEYMTHHENEF